MRLEWKEYWEEIAKSTNEFEMLGRSRFDYVQLSYYLRDINNALHLQLDDVLIDIGCSNCLVTSLLSSFCKRVIGVDYSQGLIEIACKKFSDMPNMTFEQSDICSADIQRGNKLLVGAVLQYIEKNMTICFLKSLVQAVRIQRGFIGHVPYLGKRDAFLEGYKEFIADEHQLKETIDGWLYHNSWYGESDFDCLKEAYHVYFADPSNKLLQHKYAVDVIIERK